MEKFLLALLQLRVRINLKHIKFTLLIISFLFILNFILNLLPLEILVETLPKVPLILS